MNPRDSGGWVGRITALARPGRVRVYPYMITGMFALAWITSAFVVGDGLLDAFGTFVGNDFVAFYGGARLWLTGHGAGVYDIGTQAAFQQSLAPIETGDVTPLVSPPHALLLYLPFALAGYRAGLLAWWAFTGACLWGALRITHRSVPALRARPPGALWLVTAGFYPTVMWLSYGQSTPIALLVWATSLALLRRGRDLGAGLTLSLLAFKPQLALPMVLAMAAGRRGRALVGGIIGLGVWVTVNVRYFPAELSAWLTHAPGFTRMLRADGYARWGIHSWFGASNLLLDPSSPVLADGLTALLSLATVVTLSRLWWTTPWEPGEPRWDAAMAATLAAGLLCCVQLFVYDLLLLLLPFLLVTALPACRRPGVYLDGGPILAWTVLAFVAVFASSYLSLAQLHVTATLGMPAMAVQVSAFALVGWSYSVARSGGP